MRIQAVFSGICVAACLAILTAGAAETDLRAPQRDNETHPISPSRKINHEPGRGGPPQPPGPGPGPGPVELRSYDGTGNNLSETEMGSIYTALARWMPPAYGDGVSSMAGQDRPNPRAVSNAVAAQFEDKVNTLGATDFLWQWGQFVDHDLDLTDGADPAEPADISVPVGDPWFDPFSTGTATIAFNRSIYDAISGSDAGNPRQQLNEITAWIDASNVYGTEADRAQALRALDGTGKLKTSEGNLLPFNTEGLPNAGGASDSLFLAGDVRANEQVGLTTLHTLFMREHNRLAERLADQHPDWDGDGIFEKARQLVGAEIQIITYREYLPALLGRDALVRYRGYRPNASAQVSTLFSTASYRYGHSALSPTLLRLDARGNEIAHGHLPLRDAFFDPSRIVDEGGIEPLLRGLAAQRCQAIDPYLVDDVRNFLFGPPGSGGFDLASLNIQRGRDHGLPSYNDAREYLGLERAASFVDISSDPEIQTRLAMAYSDPDQVDAWVGGLSEDALPGSHLGELNQLVVARQFELLRDGDRLWFDNALSSDDRDMVRDTTLAGIIRRNTSIGRELPDDVFHVGAGSSGPGGRPGADGSQDRPDNGIGSREAPRLRGTE